MSQPDELTIINVRSGCTAAVRWASLTMDFVGRPIPADYKEKYLYGSHFAVCSCPHDFKQYCEYGDLPHDPSWAERNAKIIEKANGAIE